MDFGFTTQDVLWIYGIFAKKIAELNQLRKNPACPFSVADIDQEISLYASVNDKIRAAYPRLEEMDAIMPHII